MSPLLGRWARWGWLATTVLMGVALLVTAWVGRQRAVAAADTVNRGQGEVLMETVRQALRGASEPLDRARLDSLLVQQGRAGLRYAGVIDPPDSVLAQAGTAVGTLPPPPADSAPRPLLTMTAVGDRIRMVTVARLGQGPSPQGSPGAGQPGQLPPTVSRPSAGPPVEVRAGSSLPTPPRGRVRRPLLVIEFEPLVAERLAAEATRTFALSAVVALALLGVALLFWRLIVLQQLTERRLELQRRLGMLGEMSAVLAHEIRNPLASLKGNAQLLAERLGAESAEGRKAELVVQEARRLEALTGDLLDFSRSGPIDIQPADPAALARECAAEVDEGEFDVRAGAAPPIWPLDAPRLRLALVNVLRNARQASPPGARPEVTVRRDGGALVFEVRDLGPGIPAGEEDRIFAPFYTTRTQGTGLGLAVALRVAELHEGTITVANHPQGGAVFRIAIPGG